MDLGCGQMHLIILTNLIGMQLMKYTEQVTTFNKSIE